MFHPKRIALESAVLKSSLDTLRRQRLLRVFSVDGGQELIGLEMRAWRKVRIASLWTNQSVTRENRAVMATEMSIRDWREASQNLGELSRILMSSK